MFRRHHGGTFQPPILGNWEKLLTATVDCKTEFRSRSDSLVRKFRSALFVRVVRYCWILSPASAFCSELPFPSLLFCNTKFRAECWKRERRRDRETFTDKGGIDYIFTAERYLYAIKTSEWLWWSRSAMTGSLVDPGLKNGRMIAWRTEMAEKHETVDSLLLFFLIHPSSLQSPPHHVPSC